jgi:hypothetical protein
MIDAIAVRQIASTSKAGAAAAGNTPADSVVNMSNRCRRISFLPPFRHVQPDSYHLHQIAASDIDR